jgi:cystathionine beta-lyase
MAYNFDRVPNRHNSNSIKWTKYPADILPFWVADMDFPAAKPILKELHKVIDQGVLGYELPSQALQETVAARMDALYKWKVTPDSVIAVTGIVSGFNVAARAFSSKKKEFFFNRLCTMNFTN